MSDQLPPSTNPNRATLYTIVVAVAVLAIWFGSTTLLGLRLPELDRAYATAIAATETAVAADPSTAMAAEVEDEAAIAATETAVAAILAEPEEGDPATQAPEPPTSSSLAATETAQPTATDTPRPAATPTPRPTNTPSVPAVVNGLPTVLWDELPPEAHDTIFLIDAGGPFPFDRDGLTFQNREGLLPDEARGYYREYTVITPGASTRGARRIVAGAQGELYYTADHYASFSFVVREESARP